MVTKLDSAEGNCGKQPWPFAVIRYFLPIGEVFSFDGHSASEGTPECDCLAFSGYVEGKPNSY